MTEIIKEKSKNRIKESQEPMVWKVNAYSPEIPTVIIKHFFSSSISQGYVIGKAAEVGGVILQVGIPEPVTWGSISKSESVEEFDGYEIKHNSEHIYKLSFYDPGIVKSIEKSKYILDLSDNWDDEGSVGYRFETWAKAIVFFSQYANYVYDHYDIIIAPPFIDHGPEGSIDLTWQKENFRIIVNVKADKDVATFYGDNRAENTFQGTLNITEVDVVFAKWLTNLK